MKRLLFDISSVSTAIMATACDAEYVEQAHHSGKVLLIVAAAIALLSWAIGMRNRLGYKVRYLLRSFGFMFAINVVVVAMVYLSEVATDINETPFAVFSCFLMMLLPFIDIIWIILTFVFWRKRALSEDQ